MILFSKEKINEIRKSLETATELDKMFDEYDEDGPDVMVYRNNPHKTGKMVIEVDCSYAYDFLSIYEVKAAMCPTDKISVKNVKQTREFLIRQLGQNVNEVIMESEEYEELLQVNLQLYQQVDAVKENPCLGKVVDDLVYKRRLAKIALQEKFFPGTELSERKFGYGTSEKVES